MSLQSRIDNLYQRSVDGYDGAGLSGGRALIGGATKYYIRKKDGTYAKKPVSEKKKAQGKRLSQHPKSIAWREHVKKVATNLISAGYIAKYGGKALKSGELFKIAKESKIVE